MFHKNDTKKKVQIMIALCMVSLFLTLPLVSAGWFSDTISKVTSTFSKIVNTVKSFFGGTTSYSTGEKVGNRNDLGSGSGSGGSVGSGGTYYPKGSGSSIGSPEVIYSSPIIKESPAGEALWHDVDLSRTYLECINCPSSYPAISGFDYNLMVEFVNKGNFIAEAVEMEITMEFPNGDKREFMFTGGNALTMAPGSYKAVFIIPNIGVDKNQQLEDYSIRKGGSPIYDIKTKVKIENDRGVDRAKVKYKYTPVRKCSWQWSGLIPSYSCKDETPKTSALYYCTDGKLIKEGTGEDDEPTTFELRKECSIKDDAGENTIEEKFLINTISPELWAGGGLTNPF